MENKRMEKLLANMVDYIKYEYNMNYIELAKFLKNEIGMNENDINYLYGKWKVIY